MAAHDGVAGGRKAQGLGRPAGSAQRQHGAGERGSEVVAGVPAALLKASIARRITFHSHHV